MFITNVYTAYLQNLACVFVDLVTISISFDNMRLSVVENREHSNIKLQIRCYLNCNEWEDVAAFPVINFNNKASECDIDWAAGQKYKNNNIFQCVCHFTEKEMLLCLCINEPKGSTTMKKMGLVKVLSLYAPRHV